MLILTLLVGLVFAAPIEVVAKNKDVVVITTTKQIVWAEFFGYGEPSTNVPVATATSANGVAPAQPTLAYVTSTIRVGLDVGVTHATPTPQAAIGLAVSAQAVPAATITESRSFQLSLRNFINDDSLDSGMATVDTPASQAAATAAATTSSNGGWFSELVGSLFRDVEASSSAPAVSTEVPVSSVVIPPQSSTSPSFDLSTAQADSTDETNSEISTASSTLAGSSKFVSLSSQIQAIVGYAEGGAGITYSPYTKSGSCKSADQVEYDILLLLAFKIIRMYSVDCSGIAYVVAAMGSHQKLFLGIWEISAVNTDLPSMAQQVLSGSRGWSAVHTVAIGNEVIDSGRGTINQVSNAIIAAQEWFELNAPSYKGPIVTVDTLTAVLANPGQMCDLGDYIAVNCHPYFSGIEASTSGTWLQSQVAELQETCGSDRTILVTESGWPTSGKTVEQAVPSLYNQLLSIKSIANVMGDQIIMFTMYNDYWKDPGAWNVEQQWGLFGDPSA